MNDKEQNSKTAKKALETLKAEKLQFLVFMKPKSPAWEMSQFKNSPEDTMLADILKSKEFFNFLDGQLKSKLQVQETLF